MTLNVKGSLAGYPRLLIISLNICNHCLSYFPFSVGTENVMSNLVPLHVACSFSELLQCFVFDILKFYYCGSDVFNLRLVFNYKN